MHSRSLRFQQVCRNELETIGARLGLRGFPASASNALKFTLNRYMLAMNAITVRSPEHSAHNWIRKMHWECRGGGGEGEEPDDDRRECRLSSFIDAQPIRVMCSPLNSNQKEHKSFSLGKLFRLLVFIRFHVCPSISGPLWRLRTALVRLGGSAECSKGYSFNVTGHGEVCGGYGTSIPHFFRFQRRKRQFLMYICSWNGNLRVSLFLAAIWDNYDTPFDIIAEMAGNAIRSNVTNPINSSLSFSSLRRS